MSHNTHFRMHFLVRKKVPEKWDHAHALMATSRRLSSEVARAQSAASVDLVLRARFPVGYAFRPGHACLHPAGSTSHSDPGRRRQFPVDELYRTRSACCEALRVPHRQRFTGKIRVTRAFSP